MAETIKARVGFVSGGGASMPHYGSFLPLVPSEVKLEHEGLELYRESLYQIADKKEIIVRRVQEFVKNQKLGRRHSYGGADRSSQPRIVRRIESDVIRAFHDGIARMRRGPERLLGEASSSTDALRRENE